MNIEKRRNFIINFLYYAIIFGCIYFIVKYAFQYITPFIIAFLIAYFLRKPALYISTKLKISYKFVALVVTLGFYALFVSLISFGCLKGASAIGTFFSRLPMYYEDYINPAILDFFDWIEVLLSKIDASLLVYLEMFLEQITSTLSSFITGISKSAFGFISNFAIKVPGFMVKTLFMIIGSFFIIMDFDHIKEFASRQLSPKSIEVLRQIREYIVGTLFVCVKSYILIMGLTFIELSISLSIIKVDNSVAIAGIIAVLDILPVLGTGGFIIPWAIISALSGNVLLGIELIVIYVIITVIRNIVEPKLVGAQLGLHPVVTLISMFVGAQLFGFIGLFGLPIFLSLLLYLNKHNIIHILK